MICDSVGAVSSSNANLRMAWRARLPSYCSREANVSHSLTTRRKMGWASCTEPCWKASRMRAFSASPSARSAMASKMRAAS